MLFHENPFCFSCLWPVWLCCGGHRWRVLSCCNWIVWLHWGGGRWRLYLCFSGCQSPSPHHQLGEGQTRETDRQVCSIRCHIYSLWFMNQSVSSCQMWSLRWCFRICSSDFDCWWEWCILALPCTSWRTAMISSWWMLWQIILFLTVKRHIFLNKVSSS